MGKSYKMTAAGLKRAFIPIMAAAFLAAISNQAAAVSHYDPITEAEVLSSQAFNASPSPEQPSRREGVHLPIILNDSVEAYIEHFTAEKKTFQAGLNNSMPYLPLMKKIFREENLPEELVYVVMIESWFNPTAVSRASAVGLWQFMAGTAREYGLRNDQWIDERRDHVKATRAAARYFRALHSRLRSWTLAMAAYNAGMGKLRQAIFGTGSEDFWDLKQSAYLRKETKSFVPKIMAAAIIARDPAAYGFRISARQPLRFDVVEIRTSTDLRNVAKEIKTPLATIKSLNPEIKGSFTPPRRYLLKVPEGKRKIFIAKRGGSGRDVYNAGRTAVSSGVSARLGPNLPES